MGAGGPSETPVAASDTCEMPFARPEGELQLLATAGGGRYSFPMATRHRSSLVDTRVFYFGDKLNFGQKISLDAREKAR
jgi:hypothetical protein